MPSNTKNFPPAALPPAIPGTGKTLWAAMVEHRTYSGGWRLEFVNADEEPGDEVFTSRFPTEAPAKLKVSACWNVDTIFENNQISAEALRFAAQRYLTDGDNTLEKATAATDAKAYERATGAWPIPETAPIWTGPVVAPIASMNIGGENVRVPVSETPSAQAALPALVAVAQALVEWRRVTGDPTASDVVKAAEVALAAAGLSRPAEKVAAVERSEQQAESDWNTVVNKQQWNDASQIIHLESFLRSKGLIGELSAYAAAAAAEENSDPARQEDQDYDPWAGLQRPLA